MTTQISHEEVLGKSCLRSTVVEISILREAALSDDLTEVIGHVCQAILIKIRTSPEVVVQATPTDAQELIVLLQAAVNAWTEPMEPAGDGS